MSSAADKTTPILVLKWRDRVEFFPGCALCGEKMEGLVGPTLFIEGTDKAVCFSEGCGARIAPRLVYAIFAVSDSVWPEKENAWHSSSVVIGRELAKSIREELQRGAREWNDRASRGATLTIVKDDTDRTRKP